MKSKRTKAPPWTAADRARREAIRREFASCPTQEQIEARGSHEGPIKGGAYFKVRVLIHELKKAREAAGLSLAVVARRTGMDQATLSRLENGRQPNPTVDTLWRYARAVGRELVLAHDDAPAGGRRNGRKLTAPQVKQVAAGFGIKMPSKTTKPKALEQIKRKLMEQKGSAQRIQPIAGR